MLYSYPRAATNDNWLHWCLIEILLRVHEIVEDNRPLPSWPNLIPAAYLDRLASRRGLRDRVLKYRDILKELTSDERTQVRDTLVRQNKLKRLFDGRVDCLELANLPESIREPAKSLFVFAFELLTDFEVRANQYRIIYESTPDKVCPFCGIEGFAAPTGPSEDFDHYLPKSRYPFAAVNLWNLVPAGADCNRKYKNDRNPLFKGASRRRALNPYACSPFRVSLMSSVPFGAPNGIQPDWKVEFEPTCEEAETWDDVFDLKTRYVRDVLNPHWTRWISGYLRFACKMNASTDEEIRELIPEWCDILREDGLNDMAFLKVAFFEMVQDQIDKGNEPLIRLLRNSLPLPNDS